jgi:hypothetical protein
MSPRKVPQSARYRDFTVLLARQRSGTNALRSVLRTHPRIHCFNEVFYYGMRTSDWPPNREQSYFTWLAGHAGSDVDWFMPDRQDAVFTGFLDYLRGLSERPLKVVDVKYNMVHLITRPSQALGTYALFDLVRKHRMAVLNLERRNYLRCYLSRRRALLTGVYGADGSPAGGERAMRLDVRRLLRKLEEYRREDALVEAAFARYERYLKCEYTEVFTPEGKASPAVLKTVAAWLGVKPSFDFVPKTAKLTSLPLWEAIENWDEVEAALRPTRFAYCLDDEPSYVARADSGSGRAGAPARA